jgi:hypothetical protein
MTKTGEASAAVATVGDGVVGIGEGERAGAGGWCGCKT